MIRDPHFKSPRRARWAAAAVFLLALPSAASAQGLFSIFGGGGPSPDEIERRLEASGYIVTGPLILRGDVYLADVMVRGEGAERLIVDPQSGRVLQRFRAHGDRWREAAVPPDAWGDDPRTWNGPRPPADINPGPPPDAWFPSGPDAVETPKPEPRKVEIRPRPKSTPVANVVNPPAMAPSPAATMKPVAPVLVKPAPLSTPAAAASPRPTTPAIQAAKADTPSVTPKPTPTASAKMKSINDIPVTPPD
jgi:hypothetical protein